MDVTPEKLDQYHSTYRRNSPFDDLLRSYTFQALRPFLPESESTVLEIGCSNGLMTELLAKEVRKVVAVEGSLKFIDEVRSRKLANVELVHSVFEELQSEEMFDAAFATFILTHVPDPKAFFSKLSNVLKPGGLAMIAVPNARSVSRQLAQELGFVENLLDLTDNDLAHGHCVTFDRASLSRLIRSNGYEELAQGGIMLKPFADFQMDEIIAGGTLKDTHFEGLFRLGQRYPELAAVIYSVCCQKT